MNKKEYNRSVADMWKQSYYLVLGVIIFCFFFLISCGGGGGGGGSSDTQSPLILVSNTNIDFGDIVVDNFSEQVFTIKNAGSSTLSIGQIAQANTLDLPFSILNNTCSGMGLTANQTCTFNIRFSPTIQGQVFTDSFDIPSNATNFSSVKVSVTGKAEGLRLSINQITTNNFPNIELIIAVSDKDGIPITDLNNVTLSENGVEKTFELTPLTSVMPISVAMALDFSDTMTPYYADIKNSSIEFVQNLLPDDEAEIIKFAKTIELKQSFTDNQDLLYSAINNNPYNGDIYATHMYDALWYAIDNTAVRPNHRSIVLISDGYDEDPANTGGKGSVRTLTEVINHAKETNVSIYTIGLGNQVFANILNQLANETGGQYFAAPNSDQLAGIYGEIRDILNGQYQITYSSSSTPCVPITVNVVVDWNGFQGDAVKQVQKCP
jgi:VWFA-related protein